MTSAWISIRNGRVPSIMAAICFFAGVNMLFLGLIGEYVGRIFLGYSNTPQFVVRRIDENGKVPYILEDGKKYVLTEDKGEAE